MLNLLGYMIKPSCLNIRLVAATVLLLFSPSMMITCTFHCYSSFSGAVSLMLGSVRVPYVKGWNKTNTNRAIRMQE
jgi:hypothetical protein